MLWKFMESDSAKVTAEKIYHVYDEDGISDPSI